MKFTKLTAATTLAAALFLAACGNKETTTTTTQAPATPSVTDTVKDTASNVVDAAKDAANTVADAAKDAADAAKDKVTDLVNSAKDAVAGALPTAFSAEDAATFANNLATFDGAAFTSISDLSKIVAESKTEGGKDYNATELEQGLKLFYANLSSDAQATEDSISFPAFAKFENVAKALEAVNAKPELADVLYPAVKDKFPSKEALVEFAKNTTITNDLFVKALSNDQVKSLLTQTAFESNKLTEAVYNLAKEGKLGFNWSPVDATTIPSIEALSSFVK